MNRYDRQISLFGYEGQEKLKNSKVSVIGSNLLSDFVISALASLGIGNIFLLANERKNKRSFLLNGAEIFYLKDFLKKFNNDVNFYPIYTNITRKNSTALIPKSDVVVDVTHDNKSKYYCAEIANKNNVILGYATKDNGVVAHGKAVNLENILDSFYENQEDVVSCEIIGGLIVDEIRKIILPKENEEKINYNIDFEDADVKRCGKIGIVGAGALGNWVGIGLSLMDIKARIIDYDIIEETNLNRQFMFYNDVGSKKAKTLAKRLSLMGKKFKYSCKKFDGVLDRKYNLLISCVDNRLTRLILNNAAYDHRINLVNGGTDGFNGNVEIYIPGKNACLFCQGAIPEKDNEKNSCIGAEPSSIISNLVVSGLMLQRIRQILGDKINGYDRIFYSSEFGINMININSGDDCRCKNLIK